MTLVSGRSVFATWLVLLLAGCQSDDLPPQPGYVSYAPDRAAVVAPSVTAARSPTVAAPKDRSYFIEFRSRYALSYGHTYVVFGRVNDSGKIVSSEVAGLHPASSSEVPYVLGHFLPVPAETGWSDGDLEEAYRSASWRVMLSEPEYRDVVAEIRKLQESSPVWQASVYNCNAFTGDIARSMGYKIPSKYLRPQQFITKLREMNSGSASSAG
jgi:hypothetical protein